VARNVLARSAKTPRRTPGETGSESRRFEQLVIGLAVALIRVAVDEIDNEVNRWLERIVLTLGLDRSTVAEIRPTDGWACFTHGWTRDEKYRVIGRSLDANALLPWVKAQIQAGKTVVMGSVQDLPKAAAVDRNSFQIHGPKSTVMTPIRVGGVVIGAMGFACVYTERQWPVKMVQRFQTIAEILGYALERKRAVSEQRRMHDELIHVSRANQMGELAASIAHELNQPLAAILSNAETVQSMLEAEQPDFAEVKAAIADIVQDDNRASETIRGLRALFRREKFERCKLDLAEMLGEVRRIVQGDAAIRNVAFSLEVLQPLPAVLADRIQLQQAVINLLLNAFDAVSSTTERPREVGLIASMAEGGVRIAVRDSGEGIEPAIASRIFEPFFTTKDGGMGMGLAISRSIAEAHGGRLSVLPGKQRGTTFTLVLPAMVEAAA
jgi:signal transduction histidine kinase